MTKHNYQDEVLNHLRAKGLPCPTDHAGMTYTTYEVDGGTLVFGECADCGGMAASGDARAIVNSWSYRNGLDKNGYVYRSWSKLVEYWKRVGVERSSNQPAQPDQSGDIE